MQNSRLFPLLSTLAKRITSLTVIGMLAVPPLFASSPTSTTSPAQYDGETLFRGVFLDNGPVADLLPEIWKNPLILQYIQQEALVVSPAQQELRRQKLIAALRLKDPTFFYRFATALHSGDRISIDAMIGETLQDAQAIAASESAAPEVLPPDYMPSPVRYVNTNYAVNLAYAVNVLLVVNIGVVLNIGVVVDADPVAAQSHLSRDMMVDLLAQRMAVQ
jgi:SdpC family antimicrobial peptide